MLSASALLCLPRAHGMLPAGTVVPALLLQRGVVPPPAPGDIAHVDDLTVTVAEAASTSQSSPGRKRRLESEHEEDEPSCPCCRAAGKKAKKSAPENGPPAPSRGGSACPGCAPIKVGILTVSDRASQGIYRDQGGPAVLRCIDKLIKSPWSSDRRIVPDEQRLIEAALLDLADRGRCSLIITTGGTGPSPRDVTPEATKRVCDRIFPGFGEIMRAISLKHVPTAVLSRQTAGTHGDTA